MALARSWAKAALWWRRTMGKVSRMQVAVRHCRVLASELPRLRLGEVRPSYTLPCGLVSEAKLTRGSIDQELAKGKLLFYTVVDLDTLIAVNPKKW